MVLIYIDHAEGQAKKASLEALTYGADLAKQLGAEAQGLVLGNIDNVADLGKYGVSKINVVKNGTLDHFDAQVQAKAIADAAQQLGAKVIVMSHNQDGRAVAPRLSARLKAGVVTGAVALPNTGNGFTVKKSVFSGKAFANINITTDVKIISINPNSYHITESGSAAAVNEISIDIAAPKIKVTATNKVSGEVPLTEAEVVVSGGRGLKGPENWGIVEDLAKVLHAATACSRPVADAHWRPHHEHVGQTGVQIAPNLYFALGISGAIQHLAGVNRSKVIVVINKDPEAPFFKAADYGIVGDVFEVVPKLTEEIKKLKGIS